MASAGSFTQTISLEGAEDVRAKLQAIGSAGEQAFGQLRQAAGAAGLQNVAGTLDRVKASATSMANGLQEAANSIGNFGGVMTLLAGRAGPLGLAIAGVGTALFALSRNAVDSVTATARTAESLGLTVAQFKALSKAAREAGIDQDTLTSALRRFSNFASEGAKDQFKAIAEIAKLLPSVQQTLGSAFDARKSVEGLEQVRAGVQRVAEQLAALSQKNGLPISAQRFAEDLTRAIQGTSEQAAKLRDLLRQAGEAIPGTNALERLDEAVKKNAGDFQSLGVSLLQVKDGALQVVSTAEAFNRFADAIARLPDGFQKTAIVQRIFGREASVLIPLLNEGAAGAEKFKSAFERLAPEFARQRDEAFKAKIAFDAMDDSFTRFKNNLGVGLAPSTVDFFDTLGRAIEALKEKAADSDVLGNLLRGVANGSANIKREFESLRQFFSGTPLLPNLPTVTWDQWLQSLIQRAQTTWEQIKQIFAPSPLPENLPTASWDEWLSSLVAKAQAAWDAIKKMFSEGLPTPDLSEPTRGGFGDQSGFARGGQVWGRGTSTSDSILAWLSRGEFVINAKAVDHFGAPFFAALNAMRAPGFNLGGLADSLSRSLAVPRFAMGGAVLGALPAGIGHMNVDLRTNHGTFRLMASQDVARSMAAAARDSADAQTGRRPAWYHGR